MKKIVILAGNVPTTTFIDALINAMAEQNFKMVVIGKKSGNYEYHKNVEVLIIPRNRISQFLFIIKHTIKSKFRFFVKIYKNCNSKKVFFHDLLFYLPIISANPDRLHIQWATFLHTKELLFTLFPNKILLSLRGSHINYKPISHPEIKEAYLKMFPKVYKFHAVSNAIAEESKKYNAPQERIQTIYSCVKDEILIKEIFPKKIDSKLKIISVGVFYWMKGYEYALDALKILESSNLNFLYTLIAKGDIPDSIRFQIHQLNLENNVCIINGLSHDEVLKKIEESDVLLLPSVEEGIANVALEAMALGTPVISTDCGGMTEVIENGVNGNLVRTRDTSDMAGAIIQFNALNNEERFFIASNAKKTIKERFNSKIFKNSFKIFYSS